MGPFVGLDVDEAALGVPDGIQLLTSPAPVRRSLHFFLYYLTERSDPLPGSFYDDNMQDVRALQLRKNMRLATRPWGLSRINFAHISKC